MSRAIVLYALSSLPHDRLLCHKVPSEEWTLACFWLVSNPHKANKYCRYFHHWDKALCILRRISFLQVLPDYTGESFFSHLWYPVHFLGCRYRYGLFHCNCRMLCLSHPPDSKINWCKGIRIKGWRVLERYSFSWFVLFVRLWVQVNLKKWDMKKIGYKWV